MFDKEIWRGVDSFNNFYASSHGRVKHKRNRIVETWENKYGQICILLEEPYVSYRGRLDKLIAIAFFGNYDYFEIEHIDNDLSNNHIDNFRFMYDDPRTGLPRQINTREIENGWRILDKRVRSKIQIIETREIFDSVSSCSKSINGKTANVYACLNGRLNSHRGFTFRRI